MKKDPKQRLGCGNGLESNAAVIKAEAFFNQIGFARLEAGIDDEPPFKPDVSNMLGIDLFHNRYYLLMNNDSLQVLEHSLVLF